MVAVTTIRIARTKFHSPVDIMFETRFGSNLDTEYVERNDNVMC